MSRKSQTTATFAVTVQVPVHLTLQQARNLIFAGVADKLLETPVPFAAQLTVSLTKKVTTYGQH